MGDNEIVRFMEAISGHTYEILFLVTLFTGMRQGEILGLSWRCVDFDRCSLLIDKRLQLIKKDENSKRDYYLVSTKSGKPWRIVPAAFVMELLRKQKSRQAEWRLRAGPAWEESDLVFTDELGGHLKHSTVYYQLKK